jgi:hypothetical protein
LTRRITLAALAIAAVAALVAAPLAQAEVTKAEAVAAAKKFASKRIAKFGVGARPQDIKASCKRDTTEGVVNTFHCKVNFNGGQCKGTLTVYEDPPKGLKANAIRISCGE